MWFSSKQYQTIIKELETIKVDVKDLLVKAQAEKIEVDDLKTVMKAVADDTAKLSDQLKAAIAANDPAAIQAVADAMAANADGIKAAIATGTAADAAVNPPAASGTPAV